MNLKTVAAGTALGLLLVTTVFLSANTSQNKTSPHLAATVTTDENLTIATFAGGCFWCVEAAFEKVPGVIEVISGYTGGEEVAPSYKQVASGATGHTEAVQVHYDNSAITYDGLLAALWRTADPTDNGGQYVDRGKQYRPEIFYHNTAQQLAAEKAKTALDQSGRYQRPVVINVTPASDFYPAEEYHQDYYKKNPVRYNLYTRNSGRYQFIDSVWPEGRAIEFAKYQPELSTLPIPRGKDLSMSQETLSETKRFDASTFVKPTDAQLRNTLSGIEYKVTQKDGTERAFSSPLHDEKRAGLYVDVVSGQPLFSSSDKVDSRTGWPSFIRAIDDGVVVEKEDRSLFGVRTEIRSSLADSHLGHVFNDGPAPTGLRYCMNAAAMRFIPVDKMADAGYADYIERVSNKSTSSL